MNDHVTVLGTVWKIEMRKPKQDAYLKECGGYCDNTVKLIVIRKQRKNPRPDQNDDLRELERQCLRHEIVHAMLYESGLAHDSNGTGHWAMHEEMVDWIAKQHCKMHKAFEEAGAL